MDAVDGPAATPLVSPVPDAGHLPVTDGARGAGTGARAAHRGLFDFVLPPKAARVLIVVLPSLAAAETVWAQLVGQRSASWAIIAVSLLITAAIIVMAWRPTWGAGAMALVGFAAVAAGQGGEYLTAVALSAGVVFYCCSAPFSMAYGVASVAWVALIATVPPGLGVGGVVAAFLVGTLSAAAGRGLRTVVRRNLALTSQVDAHEAQLDAALAAERNRIADELHDVIAHEISITVMHARVLERTDDPETRSSSQRAIVASSTQALADTRRVLQLVHGRAGTGSIPDAVETSIRRELEALAQKLRDLGHEVRTEVTGDEPLAGIITATLIRAAREAVTNVVKHADPSARVDLLLSLTPHVVVLTVENDANRPPPERRGDPSFGLARLRERVDVLGGTFAAGPDGDRWRVRVELAAR